MKKIIGVEGYEVLYNRPFSKETLLNDWKIHGGEWWLENGWLNGKNAENVLGMIVSRMDYPYNILMDFEAATVLPSTYDIDFMWNGCWNEEKNERGAAYVGGIEG